MTLSHLLLLTSNGMVEESQISDLWEKFLFHFCKVEVVCWCGEPTWLGWILIGVGGLISLYLCLVILIVLSSLGD